MFAALLGDSSGVLDGERKFSDDASADFEARKAAYEIGNMVKVDSGAAADSIMAQFYYGTLPTSMPSACASPTTTH